MHEPSQIIYKRCSGSRVPKKYFSSAQFGNYKRTVAGSYTVTAGYIFCSPLAWGYGDWICR